MNEYLTIVNIGLTLVNIAILGLVIKLYTEHFKDRSQELNHRTRHP